MPGVGAAAPEKEAPSKGDGVVRITNVSEPVLTVFRAPMVTGSAPAVIICPGGGYQIPAFNKEGTDFAILVYPAYLADKGVLAKNLTVSAKVPSSFIAHSDDDKNFIDGSRLYAEALAAAKVPHEFALYPTGGHGYGQTFFDAFSSTDMVNWKMHSRVLDIRNVSWAAYALLAPAIVRKDDKYYLFFGANDIQDNEQPGGIGVAVSDKPDGPFLDHIGKPLINRFHNGAQPIDQFVFRDLSGRGWRGASHCRAQAGQGKEGQAEGSR